MGIDLATWRARVGLSYYHMCRPLQTRWRSSGGPLSQPRVASWGVGEVMNDTSLVLKGCMTVVALSLILQYAVSSWSKLRGRGGGGKVRCHRQESTFHAKGTVDGGGTLMLRTNVVVLPLLLVIAGDVELNPGPEEPTLLDLLEKLYPVCTSWYNIGLLLHVPYDTLDRLKQMYTDPLELMREMLKHWLKAAVDPHPTWEAIVEALRSPLVNEKNVAEQLESRYCAPVRHVSKKSNNDSTSPSLTEGSHKTPFGCGCGKCTFFSFIDRGCPTPIPTKSSFPYLDFSELNREQQQELKTKLCFESQNIMTQFQKLVSATIKSFKRRCVPLDELVSHVMTLGALDPVFRDLQLPVFCFCFKELKAADTIPRVFIIINDYISFFNYRIIEHIIKELGTEKDKARLQSYKEHFNQYAKRRIFECQPELGPVSDADHADIFVKLDSQYDNYTVEQIEVFCHELSEILCVSAQGILRLCRVYKGCFQLMFQVPTFVQQEIFPLSKEQERALSALHVIRLTCGEYQFKKDEPQTRDEKIHQHDPDDDDSGKGPSTFTDTKSSTTFSEDRLDTEMKEIDYELRVQGLVQIASSYKPGSRLKLHFAVAMGQLEYVRFLVEKMYYNPMQRDPNGVAAFHVAASVGNVQILKYFISERNLNPACQAALGLTPLHLASQGHHLDVVKYLVIEKQIDPLCEDHYGNTPLHRACAVGCKVVVEFLISELTKYAPMTKLVSDLKNKWKNTPLHIAVGGGHLDIVKFFISDHNCDPNILGQDGGTLLHHAAHLGYLHIVKYLIDEQGCDPSCLVKDKVTPLYLAAMVGHMNIVQFLTVIKHCDPISTKVHGNSAFHIAVVNGHLEIVKFFIEKLKCPPDYLGMLNLTPLQLARTANHSDIAQYLQEHSVMDYIYTAIGMMISLGYLTDDQFKYLTGFNLSSLELKNCISLILAAKEGNMNDVKFLTVEKHCDPMCREPLCKRTPLHVAALNGHIEIVKFLTIEMHCDPTSTDANHETVLQLTVAGGHLDILKFLISDQNCDPSIPGDSNSRTLLHYAAGYGHLHIIQYLIDERKCHQSCLDGFKCTPLHYATVNGHKNIVKFLTMEKHCDPMLRNSLGCTVLDHAVLHGHLEIVKFLIEELKCPPDTLGPLNVTPLQLATNLHSDIVQYLQQSSVIPYIYTAISMMKLLGMTE